MARARLPRGRLSWARRLLQELGKPVKKAPPKRGTCLSGLPSLGVVPVVNVLADLILREAIALLDFALELISWIAGGRRQ